MGGDWEDELGPEVELKALFSKIQTSFGRIDRLKDTEKKIKAVKDVNQSLMQAKQLIKDFEREARAEDMPSEILTKRKKVLVDQLNAFIVTSKSYRGLKSKEGAAEGGKQQDNDAPREDFYSNEQVMDMGRKKIKDTDQRLDRLNRVVEGTIQIGQTTAETLKGQTEQMERIVNDLEDVHFNLKKASQMIRDVTRALATDKCIMSIFTLILGGVIAIIALKSSGKLGGNKSVIQKKAPPPPARPPPPPPSRKLLEDWGQYLVAATI